MEYNLILIAERNDLGVNLYLGSSLIKHFIDNKDISIYGDLVKHTKDLYEKANEFYSDNVFDNLFETFQKYAEDKITIIDFLNCTHLFSLTDMQCINNNIFEFVNYFDFKVIDSITYSSEFC